MPAPPPLLSSGTMQWLRILLSVALLVALSLRYKKKTTAPRSSKEFTPGKKAIVIWGLILSSVAFHNVGLVRGGTFVHYGDMFHYYLGSKYFEELGYFDLYNAVIVADTEQNNALAGIPFYTDLRTYQNAQRETAIGDSKRVRGLFSNDRWNAFKDDVSFFKTATGMPRAEGLRYLVTDHGYNPSPTQTLILGTLTNAVPVTQLWFLAALDVLLVGGMLGLVFHTFGFEMGAVFSFFFYANALNDPEYVSGGLLRFDWLFCIVLAVCLLKKERYASSSFFLTLSTMIRVFPAALFSGIAISFFQTVRAARAVDGKLKRFVATAAATGVLLFALPAVSFGSPQWNDFRTKIELHDSGVYVNHVGLRGILLFEPNHLSLDRFVQAYRDNPAGDLVRNWQDAKEKEWAQKNHLVLFYAVFVLACLTAIIRKGNESASESVLWPLLLVYTISFPSQYYYAFLCLFILLFFRRADPLGAFVPIGLLLVFNIVSLVTRSFEPSPIVYFTLINIYLFVCLLSILSFEMYNVLRERPAEVAASPPASVPHEPRRSAKPRGRKARARRT